MSKATFLGICIELTLKVHVSIPLMQIPHGKEKHGAITIWKFMTSSYHYRIPYWFSVGHSAIGGVVMEIYTARKKVLS